MFDLLGDILNCFVNGTIPSLLYLEWSLYFGRHIFFAFFFFFYFFCSSNFVHSNFLLLNAIESPSMTNCPFQKLVWYTPSLVLHDTDSKDTCLSELESLHVCILSKKEHYSFLPHSSLMHSRKPEACSCPCAIFATRGLCSPGGFLPLWNEGAPVNQLQLL